MPPDALDLFSVVFDDLFDPLKLLVEPFGSLLEDAPNSPFRRGFAISVDVTSVVDQIHLSGLKRFGEHAIGHTRLRLDQRGLIQTLAFGRIYLDCREVFDGSSGGFG